MLFVSPLVCTAIGSLLGGSYLALTGISEGEPIGQMVLSVPMAMLFSKALHMMKSTCSSVSDAHRLVLASHSLTDSLGCSVPC